MKRLYLFIGLLFSLAFYAQAQVNLIKNPSLEEYTCCPNNTAMIDCADFWTQPDSECTSDYFNICAIGSLLSQDILPCYQHPYFGNGYAGIICNSFSSPVSYREYIQGELSEPLIQNKCYHVEYWTLLFGVSYSGIDALGIYFSDTMPKKDNAHQLFNFQAQINNPTNNVIIDTTNWTKISGNFIASGGEQFFTVGVFKQQADINTIYLIPDMMSYSYYFFDNFSLYPCEDTIPPNEPPPMLYVPNIFSPNHDGHNEGFRLRSPQIDSLHLEIYNRWGNKIFETNNPNDAWDGTYQSKDCEIGNYVWWAEITFKNGKKEIRKGNVSLVR